MRKDYSYGLDSFLFFSHLFDQRRLCSRKSDIKECLKAPAHREPQETFNSLSKVLFIFPSWYLFAIGLEPAFGFKNEIYHLIYAPIPRSVTLRASTGIWRLRTVRIEPKNESCRGRTVPKNEPNRHPPTARFMKTEPNRTVVTLVNMDFFYGRLYATRFGLFILLKALRPLLPDLCSAFFPHHVV